MTDKQIIINNIDVSECEHLTETRHCKAQMAVMGTDANKCKIFSNCYYKQLKRKEQECKGLEEEVSLLKESNSKLQQIEDVNSLEKCYLQQLDQLKAEIDKKELIFAGIETSNRLLIEKNNKLKQTLTGIKEIAEENIRIADLEGLNGVYRRGLAKQILQKISEVENERN